MADQPNDETPMSEPSPSSQPSSVQRVRYAARITQYTGPIPPPEVVRQWEALVSGSADRILKMAEKQATHRMSLETKLLDGDIKKSWFGLWIGFAICIILIIGGTILIILDHDVAGTAIISTNLISISAMYIYGLRNRQQERVSQLPLIIRPPTSDIS